MSLKIEIGETVKILWCKKENEKLVQLFFNSISTYEVVQYGVLYCVGKYCNNSAKAAWLKSVYAFRALQL